MTAPTTHKFEAEVEQVLRLVIESLYSNREVFLRELVSNAADALDKLRFAAVTDPSLIPSGAALGVRLIPDREANTLTISDNGIGMSREELVDHLGTIARSGTRELAKVRWGLPSSKKALLDATSKRADKLRAKGKDIDDEVFAELLRMEPDRGTTNVRNTASRHWTRWLGVEHRCVVPFTSFAEPDPKNRHGGPIPNAWFAVDESCPVAVFAGIWVPQWTSVRKVKDGEVTIDLYGFLTTEPNAIVAPVHSKAMPVILTTAEEIETWMTAPWDEAGGAAAPPA